MGFFDLANRATLLDLVRSQSMAGLEIKDTSPHDELLRVANGLGVRVLDLRSMSRTEHYPPRDHCIQDGHDFGKWGWFRDDDKKKNLPVRAKPRGVIPWEKLTGILLHTTDVDMTGPRFLGTPVQTGIDRDGNIILCHPVNAKLWHAHKANSFTCGIEVSGKKGAITEKQIEPLRALIRYIHDERQDHHQDHHKGDMVMMAHRQSHKSRTNDPGRAIWQAGAEWAREEFGMRIGPVVGSGKPIPPEWRAA